MLCEDAVALTFSLPSELTRKFSFRAGQSLTLRRMIDGREERRTYSICAPEGAAPRIGVREVPGGAVSSWLVHDVRVGERIELQVPAGSFTPDTSQPGRHVLLAAGSGITPILSIAGSLLSRSESEVTLLYGNRRADSVMFIEEIADLKDAYRERLQVLHVLSREAQEVDILSGRLDPAKLLKLLPAICQVSGVDHWWLCGPYAMVLGAISALGDLGVGQAQIHKELFYVEQLPPEQFHHEDPALSGPGSEVTVVMDGRVTTATIAQGTSLLDGAQKIRPDLPFACKGGVCGTCRARISSGKVDMRRNFALEQDEIDAGYVLTCQAVAVSQEVTVDYDS